MRKAINFIGKTALSLVAFVGLAVGSTAVSVTTMWFSHQPECPKELLK